MAGERNYHIFYHILKGASDDLLSDLRLLRGDGSRPMYTDFNYLKQGSDVDQEIVNDIELYEEVHGVFADLGFGEEERLAVYKSVAAVLLIGELEFDGSTFDESGTPCQIKNREKLDDVASLIGIEDPA